MTIPKYIRNTYLLFILKFIKFINTSFVIFIIIVLNILTCLYYFILMFLVYVWYEWRKKCIWKWTDIEKEYERGCTVLGLISKDCFKRTFIMSTWCIYQGTSTNWQRIDKSGKVIIPILLRWDKGWEVVLDIPTNMQFWNDNDSCST